MNDTLVSINDSGGDAMLYRISKTGEFIDSIPLGGARNTDWEEIATDTLGNFFVGDFGNNSNSRKDLRIYEIREDNSLKQIDFTYGDQTEFPPRRKKDRVYDCEAMLPCGNSIFLFTKSRRAMQQQVYNINVEESHQTIQPLCKLGVRASITGATRINARTFVLAAYGNILICELVDSGHEIFVNVLSCMDIPFTRQVEGVAYDAATSTLFLTNEQGTLFLYEVRE